MTLTLRTRLTLFCSAAFAALLLLISVGSYRLPRRGSGDQLDEVADAFNHTLERLERAVTEMRQFSSALAHELRTPLAALRGDIELTLLREPVESESRRRLTSQIEEIDALTRLINQLLTLARAESGEIRLKEERVDLGALAATIVEQLEPVAQARQIEIQYSLLPFFPSFPLPFCPSALLPCYRPAGAAVRLLMRAVSFGS